MIRLHFFRQELFEFLSGNFSKIEMSRNFLKLTPCVDRDIYRNKNCDANFKIY